MDSSPLNALTIDVEDYFMVSAFEGRVSRDGWSRRESRLEANTERILSILAERGTRATFFVLGWVAEHFPGLVRSLARQGHEVACHGHEHRLIYHQTPQEFRRDVRRAKDLLEDVLGQPVAGYRAPSFSVVKETMWALDVLREEGYGYDASVLPAPHARGGLHGAQRFPHQLQGLWEFPMSTAMIAGRPFAFSGGGYFRLFPYALVRQGIRACHREGWPAIVYLHPWEFDPDQPRLPCGTLDGFRHYVNLSKTEEKFRRLLGDFSFGTAREVLQKYGGTFRCESTKS
jgi:polysaccharide deacetylase family protein (PEP-CTERM system associated)